MYVPIFYSMTLKIQRYKLAAAPLLHVKEKSCMASTFFFWLFPGFVLFWWGSFYINCLLLYDSWTSLYLILLSGDYYSFFSSCKWKVLCSITCVNNLFDINLLCLSGFLRYLEHRVVSHMLLYKCIFFSSNVSLLIQWHNVCVRPLSTLKNLSLRWPTSLSFQF